MIGMRVCDQDDRGRDASEPRDLFRTNRQCRDEQVGIGFLLDDAGGFGGAPNLAM